MASQPPIDPLLFGVFWVFLIGLIIWSVIWKAFGLWHSARNKHKFWFIVMFIFNTAGILPILYLALKTKFFKAKRKI